MDISDFCGILRANGVASGSGVPCSFFRPLVNAVMADDTIEYVPATSEGEAVAVAAGLCAGGKPAFSIMQNSGLGNAVNPITSMLELYGIPVALFVSLRGEPGLKDEPQHQRMGMITSDLLRLCGLETHVLSPETFAAQLGVARTRRGATAWVVRRSTLCGGPEVQTPQAVFEPRVVEPRRLRTFVASTTREAALRAVAPLLNAPSIRAAVVSTTGKLSRELFEIDEAQAARPNRFYMVGSMGCAAGFGLGVARTRSAPVIILDGDGALLMKLGTLATVGALGHENFFHIVFDNAAHDSTGGQPTVSPSVDFAALALAAGYRRATTVDTPDELIAALEGQMSAGGPGLTRMMISNGTRADLGRPKISPRSNYLRFHRFLTEGADDA